MLTPGQSVTVDFTTRNPTTGAAANADSTPTGTLVRNGTDSAESVTVTSKATGIYKAAVTIPSGWSSGDIVQIRIAATVSAVADNSVVWQDALDEATAGAGAVAVNHNYGSTNALRVVDGNGAGVDGATIRAYLTSDWDAGNTGSEYIVARTTSDVNGYWEESLMLDADDYTIVVFKQGQFQTTTTEITVTA